MLFGGERSLQGHHQLFGGERSLLEPLFGGERSLLEPLFGGERSLQEPQLFGGERSLQGHHQLFGGERSLLEPLFGGERSLQEPQLFGGERSLQGHHQLFGGERSLQEPQPFGGERSLQEPQLFGGERSLPELKLFGGEQSLQVLKPFGGSKILRRHKPFGGSKILRRHKPSGGSQMLRRHKRSGGSNDLLGEEHLQTAQAVLRGGALNEQNIHQETVAVPEVVRRDDTTKSICLKIMAPEAKYLRCPLCEPKQVQYCNTASNPNNARHGLKKHLAEVELIKNVDFVLQCSICKIQNPPSACYPAKWMKDHIRKTHSETKVEKAASVGRFKCPHCDEAFNHKCALNAHVRGCMRTNSSKTVDVKTRLNKAWNAKLVTSKFKKEVPIVVTPTKEDLERLEKKPQTRSVTKQVDEARTRIELSTIKKQQASVLKPSTVIKPLVTISEESDSPQPKRKSMGMNLFGSQLPPKAKAVAPSRRLSTGTAPASTSSGPSNRRKSIAIGSLAPKANIFKPRKSEGTAATTQNIDIECLLASGGNKAWLSSDVVWQYMQREITSPTTRGLDPLIWVLSDYGAQITKQIRCLDGLLPICVRDHWRLLHFRGAVKECVYYDPMHAPLPQDIAQKLRSMGYTPKAPSKYGPRQTDDFNCGVHVCLLARALSTKTSLNYSTTEIKTFRGKLLSKIQGDKSIMCIYPANHQDGEDLNWLLSPSPKKVNDRAKCHKVTPVKESGTSSDKQEVVPEVYLELKPTQDALLSSEFVEAQVSTSSDYSPSLTNLSRQQLTEITDPKLSIRHWFWDRFRIYKEESQPFSSLEWILEQFTAATFQWATGRTSTVRQILKRAPPPVMEAGEMCTQTERKERARPAKKPVNIWCTRTVRLGYKNCRSKMFNALMGNSSAVCEVPVEEVEDYFSKTTKRTNTSPKTLAQLPVRIKPVQIEGFMEEFTSEEVEVVFKKSGDTAPGADGLRYEQLRSVDPSLEILRTVYNEVKRLKTIPAIWKEAETTLIHKGGDENDLSNWRPISLIRTIYKVYSSLWNTRIKKIPGVISKCQRGFSQRDGCAESIANLRAAIEHARSTRGNIAVAWLDLTNAFGSVPHELILHSLRAFGFPEEFVEIVMDFYKGSTMRVVTAKAKTNPITLYSGVKQGDPISPTLFNIALEFLIRGHLERSDGHTMISSRLQLLAFADDMAVICNNSDQLSEDLDALDKDASSLNLIFKPRKCATLTITKGEAYTATPLKLRGEVIRCLANKDYYNYLGVRIGTETVSDASDLLEKATSDMSTLRDSNLAPWQKLDALKTFILTRLGHIAMNGAPELKSVNVFADKVKAAVKAFHKLPLGGPPNEYVQLPIDKGGLGVMCPKTLIMISSITSMLRKLWSEDKELSTLHWNHLRAVTSRFYKVEEATNSQAAEMLNAGTVTTNSGSKFTMFFRIRQAVRHLSKVKDAPLSKVEFMMVNNDLVLKVKAHGDRAEITIDRSKIKTVNKLLRKEIEESLFHRFLTSKRAGKIVEALARDKRNNTFVRNGGWVSYSGHKFVHKARLDLLHLNASILNKTENKQCRRCQAPAETMLHVQQVCRYQLGTTVTDRHNAVLARIVHSAKQGSRKDWKFAVDKQCQLDRKRPDLIITNESKKEVVITDVCIPFELGERAMQNAHNRKVEKYTELKEHYVKAGYKAQLLPIVVGSFGSWRPENDIALRQLGISRAYSKRMIELITATVIEQSKNIYWKHIHGEQYRIIPNFLPIVEPKGANWDPREVLGQDHDPPPLYNSNEEM